MAKINPDWSAAHIKKIKEIEDELGREVCGVPLGSKKTCKNWPVDKQHGRCSEHAPSPGREAKEVMAAEPGNRVKVTDDGEEKNDTSTLFETRKLFFLILPGILTGIILVAGILFYSNTEKQVNINSTGAGELDSGQETAGRSGVEFERVNHFFQNEKYDRLQQYLTRVVESAEAEGSARALYYLFVLKQRRGRYRESLRVGEEFVDSFPDHPRAPEVLYSNVKISRRYLEAEDLAKNYHNRLEKEYPQSKWTEKVSAPD